MQIQDTIVALATANGSAAIAVIRVSGSQAIAICDLVFRSNSGKNLASQNTHTIHLGYIVKEAEILDQVLVSLFKEPKSYTGEPTVEISCHGSTYVQQEIIQLLVRKGCRMARAGEFTLRAFLNKKLDLSQAEAVADLIASDSKLSHQVAIQQMRGGFSSEIKTLRTQLLHFASLLELELDFSEEDVAFADRDALAVLLQKIKKTIAYLIDSFSVGNVLRKGVPVAIVGAPNVGKSTLLNTLLQDDKAIVSDIAGTTRDVVEDHLTLGGMHFRFLDTAGIRSTNNPIESIGIQKTFEKIKEAKIILFLCTAEHLEQALDAVKMEFKKIASYTKNNQSEVLLVINKSDQLSSIQLADLQTKIKKNFSEAWIMISAKESTGLESLKSKIIDLFALDAVSSENTIITNTRHYAALQSAQIAIKKVQSGLAQQLSSDLLAVDIRDAIYHFGEITGAISNDELLGNIFSKFCIGK